MARTKGALNKRTRAALHAAQTGELGGGGESPIDYLLRVMRDSRKPDGLRIEAAKAVAPYLSPRLNSVEVNQPDPFDGMSRAEMVAQLKTAIAEDPQTRALIAELMPADKPALQ